MFVYDINTRHSYVAEFDSRHGMKFSPLVDANGKQIVF